MANDLISTLLFIVAFWVMLYILAKVFAWEKRGIIVEPFYLMLKTSFLNERLNFFSKNRERIWRVVWNIGIIVAFGQMGFIIYFLSSNIIELVNRTPQAAGMVPILPGITISFETLPYFIIALAIVLITHEFAHAIAGLVDNIPLKSAGLFFVFIVGGGFVELDEEKLEQSSLRTKLRVFSAGSSTNIAVWGLVTLLFLNFGAIMSPFYDGPSGIIVSGVIEDGGASQADMKKWDVIYSINDQPIKDVNDLAEFMSKVKPGTILILSTDRGDVGVETKPHQQDPKRALLGIYPFPYYESRLGIAPKELPYHLYWTGYWTSTLLLWIAIFNMLPLFPLDGDKMIYSLVSSKSKKAARIVRVSVGGVFLAIVVMNMVLSYMNFGFMTI